jgi:hypothetical protein
LTTYYPAPYGGYAGLLTTGQTLLARDGGNVGIGLGAGVPPAYTLDMKATGTAGLGRTYLKNSDIYFTNTGHTYTSLGDAAGKAAIENAADKNTLMIQGRNTVIDGVNVRSVSIYNRLEVNGDMYLTGTLQNACTRLTYVNYGNVSCPDGMQVVGSFGNRYSSPQAAGFLPREQTLGVVSVVGAFIGLGEDYSGTKVCCRFN